MVPGFHLGDQYMLDSLFKIGALVSGSFIGLLRSLRFRCGLGGKKKWQQKQGDQLKAHGKHCKAAKAAEIDYFSIPQAVFYPPFASAVGVVRLAVAWDAKDGAPTPLVIRAAIICEKCLTAIFHISYHVTRMKYYSTR